MSALPPTATAKADSRKRSCRFPPESGHVRCNKGCLRWANRGHHALSFLSIGKEIEACSPVGAKFIFTVTFAWVGRTLLRRREPKPSRVGGATGGPSCSAHFI